jgi:hypothetical protein
LAISEGAEIARLPIVVAQNGVSAEDMNVALVKANGGMDVGIYGVAVVCKRLSRSGMSAKEIAGRLDVTVQHVDNLLLLIGGPRIIREMVVQDRIAASAAIQAMRDHGEKAADVLLKAEEAAKAGGKTKVTPRHIAPKPGQAFSKVTKKEAPVMFQALSLAMADPAYANLQESTRVLIDGIVAKLKEAELRLGELTGQAPIDGGHASLENSSSEPAVSVG